jgi:hypothetical protein
VAVRSTKLASVIVAANTANQVVYTCPAGVVALVKNINAFGIAAGACSINLQNGGAGTGVIVLTPGTTTLTPATNAILFLVLVSGDKLRVSTPAGTSLHVTIGGAELVV